MSKINSQKCSKILLLLAPVLLWALALPIAFAPMQANIFVSAAYAHVIPGDDEPHTHPHEPETLPRIDFSEFQGPDAPGNIQLGNVHSFTLDAHDRLNTNLFQNNPLLNMPGSGYTEVEKAHITATLTGIVLSDPPLMDMAVDLATGGAGGISSASDTGDGDGNQDQKTYFEKITEVAGYLEDKNYTVAAEAYMKIAEDENSFASKKLSEYKSVGTNQLMTSIAYGNAAGAYERAGDAYVQAGDFAKAKLAYEKAATAYGTANEYKPIPDAFFDTKMAIAQAKAASAAEGKAYDPSTITIFPQLSTGSTDISASSNVSGSTGSTPGGTGGSSTASTNVSGSTGNPPGVPSLVPDGTGGTITIGGGTVTATGTGTPGGTGGGSTGSTPGAPSGSTGLQLSIGNTVITSSNSLASVLGSDAFTQIQSVAANPGQFPTVSAESVAFANELANGYSGQNLTVSNTISFAFGSPTEERALVAQFVSKFVDEVFGSPQVTSGWSVFLTPYGNFSSSTNGSSHGNTYGLSGGITHIFNEKFSLGMHFDLGSSQNYADSLSTESRTFTGSLGLNANYKFTPEWYVGASFTASFSNTYNDYATTSSLGRHSANNNHGGSSLAIGLNTGYIIQLNENHALIPEIGLSYVYSHTDANDIEWNNGGSFLNMYNDATSYDALYGNISVRWLGTFEMDENTVFKPFVSVGLRQNLSGHPMESSMVYAGTRYNNEATPDMTTFITTVGMEWVWDNFSVNLNYNGAYGAEKVNHGGGVTFGWSF